MILGATRAAFRITAAKSHYQTRLKGMTENGEDQSYGSTLQLRRYQLEMLEKSMQRNVIVAVRG